MSNLLFILGSKHFIFNFLITLVRKILYSIFLLIAYDLFILGSKHIIFYFLLIVY